MLRIYTLIILLISFEKSNAQYWSSVGTGVGDYNTFSQVYATVVENGVLYAAGSFNVAGNVPADNIAKWDGNNWIPLGTGTNGNIYALAFYNGELYAGGDFNLAGGQAAYKVAKWNGNNWSSVGPGIGGPLQTGYVATMAVYNGELYVGGYFDNISGQPVNSIAKWNGSNWAQVGGGLSYLATLGFADDMIVYNGELYVGGGFSYIDTLAVQNMAKWNGTNWSSAGSNLNGYVFAFGIHNNEIYAGGDFQLPGNSNALNIAKWNGSTWTNVGSGLNNSVYSILSHNGQLYAGGVFYNPLNCIARWNGSSWGSVSGGINDVVMAMSSFSNALIVGGVFVEAGTTTVLRIARLADTCSAAPPQPGPIIFDPSCGNSSSYYIFPVDHATHYTWTLPPGWTGSSTSIGITAISNGSGGIISVAANNGCGAGPASTTLATPTSSGPITGSSSVCEGTVQVYRVTPSPYVAEYWWTFPNGWTATNGDPLVTALTGAASGVITLTTYDACGGIIESLQFSVTVLPSPVPPGPIMGNDTVCVGSLQTYSVSNVPSADNYSWTLPVGWSGSSVTNIITATAGATSGSIGVSSVNSCGSSMPRLLPVVVEQPLADPGAIQGDESVCDSQLQLYSIDPVAGATLYNWLLPSDWQVLSSGNSISVQVGAISDTIRVSVQNSCGLSDESKMYVEVNQALPAPEFISFSNTLCQGNPINFEIMEIQGAHGYAWTLPPGWVGSSNSTTMAAIAGTVSGNVSVQAINGCDDNPSTDFPVNVQLSIPDRPSVISGLRFVSVGDKLEYSVQPVSGALFYSWRLSGGGVPVTGLSANSITIKWYTPGKYQLSVKTINTCGSSDSTNILVDVAEKEIDAGAINLGIYPNPTRGGFTITAKRIQDRFIHLDILSMTGQLVYRSGKLAGANEFSFTMDGSIFPAGVYVVRLFANGKSYTIKLVRQ